MTALVYSTRAREHATLQALKAGLSGKASEWVGYVAGWQVCFASMAACAHEIGRSARSAFRYQLAAREAGLIQSQPGDRHNPPANAKIPYPLLQHGYAIRRVIGDLGDQCRDIGRSAWEAIQRKRDRSRASWAAQRARERAERDAEHAKWKARYPAPDEQPKATGDLLGQAVARAAMPEREPVRRPMTAEQLDAELERLAAAVPWEPTGPPK